MVIFSRPYMIERTLLPNVMMLTTMLDIIYSTYHEHHQLLTEFRWVYMTIVYSHKSHINIRKKKILAVFDDMTHDSSTMLA